VLQEDNTLTKANSVAFVEKCLSVC
jgi:hypothetical protein